VHCDAARSQQVGERLDRLGYPSGYAKATARLYSRGTWEVHIQRVGTATQTTGYSTIRRIKVY
jgi:hypothetical protein